MFFQADKINNLLVCNVCEQKMMDPRIFPCGKSVCNRCVDNLADANKNHLVCDDCGKTHEIPRDGFPKNLLTQKLLELEFKEVSQSKHIVEFREILESLNSMKKDIEVTLKAGDAEIRDHCDKARNDMQLAFEQTKLKLDDIHKDFMNEIDQHEKKCQEKFKFIQQNKADIEKALNESNDFIVESGQLLRQFQIDDIQLTTFQDRARDLLSYLEVTKDKLKRDMFNECLLKFEKTLDINSGSIGKIIRQNIQMYFVENVKKMREFGLNSKVNETDFFMSVGRLNKNNIFSLYKSNNSLNLLIMDKNFSTLFEMKNLIQSKKIEKLINFECFSSSNMKTIFIFTEEKHFDKEHLIFKIRSFDKDFSILSKLKLDREPTDYEVNGENLFLLSNNQDFFTIAIYNSTLEKVEEFGQADPLLPFFFTPKMYGLSVNDNYFIFHEEVKWEDENDNVEKITLINRTNGLVETTFIIYDSFDVIRLYLNKFLLTFSYETCLLKSYNLKGKLISEIALDQKFNWSRFSPLNKEDKELCFVTYENKCFIF